MHRGPAMQSYIIVFLILSVLGLTLSHKTVRPREYQGLKMWLSGMIPITSKEIKAAQHIHLTSVRFWCHYQ